MAHSATANVVFAERVAVCRSQTCCSAICNSEAFWQGAAQARAMDSKQRRAAVVHDLQQQQILDNSGRDKPYADRVQMYIAGTAVCESCYAAHYDIKLSALWYLKRQLRSGELPLVDRRKSNGNNQHGTQQSLLTSFLIRLKQTKETKFQAAVTLCIKTRQRMCYRLF